MCREFTLLCRQLDLFAGELVAIDGSKFRAVNSKKRNFTPASLERRIREIDARITEYLGELDARDRSETGTPTTTATDLQQKIDALHERKTRHKNLRGELEASGESQRSETDPESRSMKVYGGVDVCYNVQTAVDEKHKLIVGNDVTNDATDRDQLSPMAKAANEVLDSAHLEEVVADMGYYNGPEIIACLEAGITPTVPRPHTSANAKHGLFTKDDFKYDAAEDRYRCPAGEIFTYRFSTVEGGSGDALLQHGSLRAVRNEGAVYEKPAVTPHHALGEQGRAGDGAASQGPARVIVAPKSTVEHPFGSMKRWMDQGYFLMKGLEKVGAEFSLTVLAYNLRRVITLVGVPRMMAALT